MGLRSLCIGTAIIHKTLLFQELSWYLCCKKCTQSKPREICSVFHSDVVICVLVLAGIELIFLVAGTVLCFGFTVRIMVITH